MCAPGWMRAALLPWRRITQFRAGRRRAFVAQGAALGEDVGDVELHGYLPEVLAHVDVLFSRRFDERLAGGVGLDVTLGVEVSKRPRLDRDEQWSRVGMPAGEATGRQVDLLEHQVARAPGADLDPLAQGALRQNGARDPRARARPDRSPKQADEAGGR